MDREEGCTLYQYIIKDLMAQQIQALSPPYFQKSKSQKTILMIYPAQI